MRFNLLPRTMASGIVIVALSVPLTGCAMRDFVWGLFGSSYAEGGPSDFDRRDHYEHKLDGLNGAATAESW